METITSDDGETIQRSVRCVEGRKSCDRNSFTKKPDQNKCDSDSSFETEESGCEEIHLKTRDAENRKRKSKDNNSNPKKTKIDNVICDSSSESEDEQEGDGWESDHSNTSAVNDAPNTSEMSTASVASTATVVSYSQSTIPSSVINKIIYSQAQIKELLNQHSVMLGEIERYLKAQANLTVPPANTPDFPIISKQMYLTTERFLQSEDNFNYMVGVRLT